MISMKTEIIRIYKSIHAWTGILSGMALFIAFYAGALTVFKEPLTRWASPPAAHAPVALADTKPLILKMLAAHPEAARNFRVYLHDSPALPGRVSWQVRGGAAKRHDRHAARHYMAYLDAAGQVQALEVRPAAVAGFIDVLHRVVGLPVDRDWSRWFMGIVAMLYALALISGVIVLLPTLVKDFFALRVGKNRKRMWMDAHNVVGIASLPFHLVMAITALVFAFHNGIYFIQDKVFYDGKLNAALRGEQQAPQKAQMHDPADLLTPLELVARVRAFSPTFEPTMLQYIQVKGPHALARVWGKDATTVQPWVRGGFALVDPYSGNIVNTDHLPGAQGIMALTLSSFFALHMAAFGGTLVQWMYFLLGLAGAWLFYSGNLLWIESRRRKAQHGDDAPPVQRLDARLMASATIGVCLGCVCGISLTIACSKWLYGRVDDLAAWHSILYYAMFFACIVWAFLRGGARASVHLLYLAAALALTIPLTTLLAWIVPAIGWWGHTTTASLGVDVTALFGAGCFAWMARATARRVRQGAADSVWAAPVRERMNADRGRGESAR